MLVDVHTHFLRGIHWGCEWTDHWQPVYGNEWPEVTPEEFDAAMHRVDVALVFGLRATAVGVATPHEDVLRFCAQVKTKTIPFMALDLADDDVLDQFADGVRLGMRGVKLYPVLAGFNAADAQYDKFYEAATQARVPLLWHVGATPSPVGDLSLSMPLMIDAVARRHPDLVQIMAHLGHPWQREAIAVIRKNRNVFADVSASWSRPFDGFNALVRAQEWNVVDKLLFGSDFPLWTPDDAVTGLYDLTKLRAGNLPYVQTATVEQILQQDTLRMLGLDD